MYLELADSEIKFHITVQPVRQYVSENGTDSDQCGQSPESPCRTVTPVIRQLGTITPLATLDLLGQVKDVWTGASKQFQNASDYFDEYHYYGMPVLREFPTLPYVTIPPTEYPNWIIPNLDGATVPYGVFNWETTTSRPTSSVKQTTPLSHITAPRDLSLPRHTTTPKSTLNFFSTIPLSTIPRIQYYTIQPDSTGPPITSVKLCGTT